jgi:NADPH-dependent ferric siderophore reductase
MRPEAGELDVEFVLHGHDGPASSWAARAAPGDWVGLLAQPGTYHPLPPAGWQLLAGDETALPAIGAILESLVPGTRARVFIEVPGPRDMQDLSTRGDVRITWLPRSAHPGDPSPLLRAIRQATLPEGPPYVWVAGETGLISALRRHLVAERGLDRRSICFCGYWRRGGRGRSDTRLDADGTTRHPG